ncbi:hypothetical protein CYLTODRAFT_456946 [Cylindrobasidium torrendii FP15055 ss-10]|uniref:CxC1-like cysteine cluster associated with KDZ transposases domain-containing protein n=1 Tax=Cylindrobasidium torrendii FP15055 ss-10 TaxID=1314674 RepID=A0A0D7B2K2_9AGAR|nr:hypothetical protein CYLTODRAFT_456946 [Cylindrobasidium torrendii FP15055 ss-10]
MAPKRRWTTVMEPDEEGEQEIRRVGTQHLGKRMASTQQRLDLVHSALPSSSSRLLAGSNDYSMAEPSSPAETVSDPDPVAGDAAVDEDEDSGVEQIINGDWDDFRLSGTAWRHRKGRRRIDTRDWKTRIDSSNEKWRVLLPNLVDAYLEFKYPHKVAGDTPATRDTAWDFEIPVLDIFTLKTSANIPRLAEEPTISVPLAKAGFLGNVPEAPSFAVSFSTLELYRTLRLFKASMSVEAFARTLCYYYQTPYRVRYRNIISDTFDIYLAILRAVDKSVREELGHDSPDWRVQNACPPCSYELEGEPHTKFRRMIGLDGNNSLKRQKMLGRRVADTRVFDKSDYYLSREFVDSFENEVPSRQHTKATSPETETETETGDEWEDIDDDAADPTDGGDQASACTRNWKAGAADSKKRKMWAIFDETGIFLSACQHGFILWVCDMVQSGELSKYALSMTAKGLETLGDNVVQGYDIGCSYGETILHTSLAARFKSQHWRSCVNAMHGSLHEIICRLVNHPGIIEGLGLEDLEHLERIFSASNALAAGTRFMTAYRRRVFIDLYFRQWDDEKYSNLGNFLLGNYRQALKIIDDDEQVVLKALNDEGLCEDDLPQLFKDEIVYVQSMNVREPNEDAVAAEYVGLLQEYADARNAEESSFNTFVNEIPANYASTPSEQQWGSGRSHTMRTETHRRRNHEKCLEIDTRLSVMERAMNIERRWTPADSKYQQTLKYIKERRYRIALRRLAGLVVKRLMELSAMNLANIAYKVRTHMCKALMSRQKAIRTLIEQVNRLAPDLGVKKLSFADVTHYEFLDQVHILIDPNLAKERSNAKWAQPVMRNIMRRWQRINRAKEEIVRCNIGVRRLHTHIQDEEKFFDTVLEGLTAKSSAVLGPTTEYITRRRRTNFALLLRIQQIYTLDGFTGIPTPGQRKGKSADSADINLNWNRGDHPWAQVSDRVNIDSGNFNVGDEDDDSGGEQDDVECAQISGYVDYFSSM